MRYGIPARVLTALLMQASAVTAGTSLLLDPQTSHVNGMPVASSEPARDADLYHGCSRNHVGCCGGRYQCPLAHSLLRPNRCDSRRPPAPIDDTPGVLLTAETPPVLDGLEVARYESLGPAPNVSRQNGPAAPGPRAPAPPQLFRNR